MLRPDVIDLREFYATPLGQMARRVIRRRIRTLWPNLHGLRVLGLGYATPFLHMYAAEAERVLAIMPVQQGVVHWPVDGASLVGLAEDAELPFDDSSVDRVILVHGLEGAENVRAMLREVWRILTPTGRVLAIAPNRRGLWARFDHTPFGQGHPYTVTQLSRLLREVDFSPVQSAGALYLPPTGWGFLLRSAPYWEEAGDRLWGRFSGVVMIEAEKQIYAIPNARDRVYKRQRTAPLFKPAPAGRSARLPEA